MNKKELIEVIVGKLEEELAVALRAVEVSKSEALENESKSEDECDTASLEASFLAAGQNMRAEGLQKQIDVFKGLKLIEKYLRSVFDEQIEKKLIPEDSEFFLSGLQFYSARHTWATFALNAVGVDKYTVHECLNHVDEKTRITDQYIAKDWGRINEANKKLLEYFNNLHL